MSLSAYTDGNRFLDNDKIAFPDANTYSIDVTSADRLITTVLFDVYGADVNLWDIDPTDPQVITPPIVIDISAMLAASYYYRRVYSEETSDTPYYADQLETRAMMLLDHLRSGQLGIGDAYVIGTDMSDANFWPNDTTVDLCGNPIRFFTMQDCY
jgi:hypothetical protein